LKLTNRLNLPQPIVDAVAADDYSRGASDISVTQLISPPRQIALIGAHYDELEEDVSDRIWALLGRGVHTTLERAERVAVAEQRLFMTVGPYTVSGAMDRIEFVPSSKGPKIQDYKMAFVKEMIFGVKVEREQQLNIYRVLLALNGYDVQELEAIFFLRDWSKIQAAEAAKRPRIAIGGDTGTPDYPQEPVVVHPIRMWPIEEAYAFIAERVRLHMDARNMYAIALEATADPQIALPDCTDEERWANELTFAVMKPGGKKASKVTDTRDEAEQYIAEHPKDTYDLIERPAASIRCLYYCLAAQVCEQWKAINGADLR